MQGLIDEVQRVLKPGGTVVFSDIMQGDAGGDCSSFTGQNVTTKLATPQSYKVRVSPIVFSFSFPNLPRASAAARRAASCE